MMSRFFSIPGLLVDVSEVVAVTCDEKNGYWFVLFRNGGRVEGIELGDAKSIQDYTEAYEADATVAWMTPAAQLQETTAIFTSHAAHEDRDGRPLVRPAKDDVATWRP